MPRNINKRDTRIVYAIERGEAYRTIGERHGLSYERVRQIGISNGAKPPNSNRWTPGEIAVLKNLWWCKTASELADILGKTRNAVIGKVHRIGLPKTRETSHV